MNWCVKDTSVKKLLLQYSNVDFLNQVRAVPFKYDGTMANTLSPLTLLATHVLSNPSSQLTGSWSSPENVGKSTNLDSLTSFFDDLSFFVISLAICCNI